MRAQPWTKSLCCLLSLSVFVGCGSTSVHNLAVESQQIEGVTGTVRVEVHAENSEQLLGDFIVSSTRPCASEVDFQVLTEPGRPAWLRAVPSGLYELRVAHKNYPDTIIASRIVKIEEGRVVTVDVPLKITTTAEVWTKGLGKSLEITAITVGYTLLVVGYVGLYTMCIWVPMVK